MRSSLPIRIVFAAALALLAASPSTLLAARAPGAVTEQAQTNLAGGDLMSRFLGWSGGIWPNGGCGSDPNGSQCGPNGGTQPPPSRSRRSRRTG
jgi:hypothetical protein